MKALASVFLSLLSLGSLTPDATPRGLAPGDVRPPLQFHLLSDGNLVEWKRLAGSVVVVDFWATWCAPCVGAIPKLNVLQDEFRGKKVEFFSVTYEPAAYLRGFLKDHPLATRIGIDDTLKTFETFEAWGIPVVYLFDGSGKLVCAIHPNNLNSDVIEAVLRGETPRVDPAKPWPDPAGAEKYFRKLQQELVAKTRGKS